MHRRVGRTYFGSKEKASLARTLRGRTLGDQKANKRSVAGRAEVRVTEFGRRG